MKIGFYSPYLDTFGGGERYMLSLASHFSKDNIVDIFWDDPKIKPPLARFLKIDLGKTHFVPNIFLESAGKRIFKTLGYNCLFILSDGSIPLTLASKNILHFQVPFVFKKTDFKTKLKLKKYKHIICNSYFTKGFIDKSFEVSSRVIYPPVDIASITPGTKEKIILSVGRFSKNQLHPKKQEILIEVFKELSKKAPGWKFILVGQVKKSDEKYFKSLKKSSRGYGIKLIGNLSFEKLRQLYSHASIYWHSTGFGEDENKNPEKMEHFGISTVEASAAGAVPVVIGLGGQKEIINDKKNGLLWNTKAQLFESTLSLIKDPAKLQSLSKAAVINSKRFDQNIFFKEYEKIIL